MSGGGENVREGQNVLHSFDHIAMCIQHQHVSANLSLHLVHDLNVMLTILFLL